jgi:homoserine dehydrogenase
MSKSIRLGILGLGTVGTGVVRILERNAALIERRIGLPLEVKCIAVRDASKVRGVSIPDGVLTTDPFEVVRDSDIDIVVELIGGEDLARDLGLAAIAGGKHLVTANKALLAEHGTEIRQAARAAGVNLGFEASVAGGIPIIKTIREALAANRILSIYGIINGTSNYILTTMREEGRSFDDVLDAAQRAGYAEADPTFDVGGIDAAHKLAILLNLAFGVTAKLSDIYTEGIAGISPIDIEFGREFGYTLKLLAIAKSSDGGVEARVHPTMVPDSHPIAQVGGVYNAIEIVGDAVGDLMLYGKGAGEMPTASAVVSDIMDISRDIGVSGESRSPSLLPGDGGEGSIKPIETISSLYYLRFMVADQPGVLSQISGILGRHNISIESVIQKRRETGSPVPLVVMTHTAVERDVQTALSEIDQLSSVREKAVLIRVEAEKN